MEIERRPGLVRAGAYVIVDLEDRKSGVSGVVGKILFSYPKDDAGVLYASMYFTGNYGVQDGKASGFGYDKESTAINGMRFGASGREFVLDCRARGMDVVREQFATHGYSLVR